MDDAAQKRRLPSPLRVFLQSHPMSPAWMREAADIGFFLAAIELGLLDKEVELDAHSKSIRTKTLGSGYFTGARWRSTG
ncbi:hypothetical protein [Pseudomonas koreensis]|uniref:hypothetical protein n=1 Tax=Pseudomonas koreensis TaxID=198620 RepID=UPI00286C1FCD|nr:hypothetical protein [Pseudomonas koreensis]